MQDTCIKRKRIVTNDNIFNDLNDLNDLNDASTPISQSPETDQEAKHWRKLRLLEARLVGRVLDLQKQQRIPTKNLHSSVYVTETLNPDMSDTCNSIAESIIPASPYNQNSPFSGLLQNSMISQCSDTNAESHDENIDFSRFEITNKRKTSPNFTQNEDNLIQEGYRKFGDQWDKVMQWADLSSRSLKSIKRRWAFLQKRSQTVNSPILFSSPNFFKGSNLSNPPASSYVSQCVTPVRNSEAHSTYYDNLLISPNKQDMAPSTPTGPRMKRIDEYFSKTNDTRPKRAREKKGGNNNKQFALIQKSSTEMLESLQQELVQKSDRITDLEKILENRNSEISNMKIELEHESDQHKIQLEKIQLNFEEKCKKATECSAKANALLIDLMKNESIRQGRLARQKMYENSLKLASVSNERRGIEYQECWKEGYLFSDLQDLLSKITKERDEIEKTKKVLMKRLKHSRAQNDDNLELMSPKSGQTNTQIKPISFSEYSELEEIARIRLSVLKKDESECLLELDKLAIQRDIHIREVRRIRDEDMSRFNNHPIFENRYLLLQLIGKGGFSEVYKCFDLQELRYVACKIHSLSDQWAEERKKSYIKHSIREYHIHKSLDHPRVVHLFDVFELDHFSFCTILEFMEGNDLESYLSSVKTIPEKEAHSILVQVMAALQYLNELKDPIIHYDLKPANILYHNGNIKITDFGLSKILTMEDDLNAFENKEMALTSQGAGTYWYLPPEVFCKPKEFEKITISSKVDVWSLGCIFYEILYGSKPFGHNKSQHSILKESTILNESQHLIFPSKPVISFEAKEFIKKCLEHRKEKRPDVLTLSKDSYICHFNTSRKK